MFEGVDDIPAALEELAGGKVGEAIKNLEAGDGDALEELGKDLENLFGN